MKALDDSLRIVRDREFTHDRPRRRAATHPYAVVLWMRSGHATFEVGTPMEVRAGDLVLIPTGLPHRSLTSARASAHGLMICTACWRAAGEHLDALRPFEQVSRGAAAVVRVPPERHPWLDALCDELARVLDAGQASRARNLVALILAEFEQHARWTGEGRDTLVQDVLRYVETHALEPLTVAQIARAMHRSPTWLTTVVKRETGQSIQAWLTAARINEAKRRLLHSDEAVDVIANRVGYADTTNFIRRFRKLTGVTPGAFRAAR